MSEATLGPESVIGGRYRLERHLGETSLGDLYLATRTRDEAAVRVEILAGASADDDEKIRRLLQEIELIASLDHPNIVPALDAGQDGDVYYLVTRYEDGRTLQELLDERGAIPEQEMLRYAMQVAKALKYAWEERRILHRDIKPQTIFVTDAGVAKLTGFGIAKSSESLSMGLTGVGFTIGTPEYMSPEQIRAEDNLDFRADLYSLGCVLYEAVTGSLPFSDPAPILIMHKHMDEELEPANQRNPAVSEACAVLVDRMMAKDRADRPESWQALIDEIGAVPGVGVSWNAPAPPPYTSPVAGTVLDLEYERIPADRKETQAVMMWTPIVVLLIIIIILLVALIFAVSR
jgi:eukaryotic-like serine/threonine-protein kinase